MTPVFKFPLLLSLLISCITLVDIYILIILFADIVLDIFSLYLCAVNADCIAMLCDCARDTGSMLQYEHLTWGYLSAYEEDVCY